MLKWKNNISTISKTVEKYPQEIYATLVRVIQSEWIFLQHVTWDMGDAFVGVERIIRENFSASSFLWKEKNSLTHNKSSKYDVN